jgi:hypothetical protein
MIEEDYRARIERLEALVARLGGNIVPGGVVILAGDVVGPTGGNSLAQIGALAGGGNRLVGVNNAGFVGVGVVPPPGPQPMGGDVTGTTAASVITKIAALAGGGSRLVVVDNAGIVSAIVPVLPMGGDVTGSTVVSALTRIAALAGGGVQFVTVDNAGNIGTGVPPTPPFALAGDVTGTTAASVVVKINGATVPIAGAVGNVLQVTGAAALGYGPVNLAGGANFVTGLLPAANQASQAMGGDVTGTTAASVLSKVASLAGGGTVLVAVDNAGNVTSGGAVPGPADPFAFISTTTDNLIPTSSVRNYDFDLSGVAFTNSEIRLRARGYGTTKDTGGVPGANLTGSAYVVTDAVYENKNGVVTFVSAAAGGAANPMPAVNNEMTLEPQACDAALQSGGGAPPNLAWTVTGGTTARLQWTATNNVNRGSVEIDVYRRVKAAP